ncbi:MAG: chemotaxis protein CheW [bacterium]|nr:chemotaxis protein CheW [bacterium]
MEQEIKKHFLVFNLGKLQFALPLTPVERVIRAVGVTLLPKAPVVVAGIINYKGHVLPVIDIRPRFKLEKKDVRLNDQFVIFRTAKRSIAIITDTVTGDIEIPAENVVTPSQLVDDMAFLQGVIKRDDGVMLIPDLDKILTRDEEIVLSNTIVDSLSKKKSSKKRVSKK